MSLVYWITTEQEQRLAIVERPRGDGWLEDDIKSLYEAGIEVLVSALMPAEERELGLTEEAASCSTYNIEFIWLPIDDRSVPRFDHAFTSVLLHIRERMKAGKAIGIHCRACIGRSSVIAASLLVQENFEPEDAFFLIGSARRCPVPDTDEQNEWVYEHVEQLRNLVNEADNG